MLARLFPSLNYSFSNIALLEQALSHRSSGTSNNERLEFLGDSLLGFIIAEALGAKFPNAREGQLTRLRAELVKGDTLAEIARELNLGEYLKLGPGELKSGGFRRPSILADALEAVIGAIYLDSNIDLVREAVLYWYNERIGGMTEADSGKDPKTALQEMLQARGAALPSYTLVSENVEDSDTQFTIRCEINSPRLACEAKAPSKRKAEKLAARAVLAELNRNGVS